MHARKHVIQAAGVDRLPTTNNQPGTSETSEPIDHFLYTARKALIRQHREVQILLRMVSTGSISKMVMKPESYDSTSKFLPSLSADRPFTSGKNF